MNTRVYAIKAREDKIQKCSSSGGAFILLSNYVFSQGGAVACSVYDYSTHMMKFKLLQNEVERNQAVGSKYIQSNPNKIYQECYQWLIDNPGKELMFVGMGCQAAAFQLFAEKKAIRNRVIIVDIVCHGVPSPVMWKEYVQYLEKKHKGTISSLSFKDKRNGWSRPTAVVKINEKEIFLRNYIRIFNSGVALRPSCYSCPYTCINRNTDITIGDYWGIENTHPEFMSELGVSLFMTHSELGNKLFEKIASDVDWIETDQNECRQPQLHHPSEISPYRNLFWEEYKTKGVKYVMHKYGDLSLIEKIYYKFRALKQKLTR